MARQRRSVSPAVAESQRFLHTLFDDAPPSARVLVWTLPEKTSHWYEPAHLDEAAELIASRPNADVYVGVALSPKDFGRARRCAAKDTVGIVALWADVDYADAVHRKSNLPPDVDAARDLVCSAGLDPSIIVHSGHGLQAWWLLDEPWIFPDDAARDAAAELALRWQATLRARATERGWTMDATQDLSRVLRIPGTENHKSAPAQPVTATTLEPSRRYSVDDFREHLVDESEWQQLPGRRGHVVTGIELDPTATPPFDKHSATLDNDQTFRRTWDRTRKDLKDDSPSAWDLALANQAAALGWSDQEMVDLLIASRRKHGDDLKLRADYYARTIATARDDRSREIAVEDLAGLTEDLERATVVGNLSGAHHTRRRLVDEISTMLGFDVDRFVKYNSDPPRYRMETPTGNVMLGNAMSILQQTQMRAAIASATNFVIPIYKMPKWHTVAQAVFSACEEEDTGLETTDAGLAYAWLTEYLQDRTVLNDREQAVEQQWPFVDETGHLFVFGAPLRRWLWMSRTEHVTPQRMGEVLRSFGASPDTISVVIREKRSTRNVWRVGEADDLGIPPAGRQGSVNPGDEPEPEE